MFSIVFQPFGLKMDLINISYIFITDIILDLIIYAILHLIIAPALHVENYSPGNTQMFFELILPKNLPVYCQNKIF